MDMSISLKIFGILYFNRSSALKKYKGKHGKGKITWTLVLDKSHMSLHNSTVWWKIIRLHKYVLYIDDVLPLGTVRGGDLYPSHRIDP